HPERRGPDDRSLQADDILAQVDDVSPPQAADVPPQRHAVRTVVVQTAKTAVDLARGIDEPTALAERRDLLHQVLTFLDHAYDLIWRRKRRDLSWRSRWYSSCASRTRSTSSMSAGSSLRRRYSSMPPVAINRSTLSAGTGTGCIPGSAQST